MFVYYYNVLEIEYSTSESTIKQAFRSCSIKYHPDKNPDIDTTSKMQDINEAYLILKDQEAKARYDTKYFNYKEFYYQECNNQSSDESSKKDFHFSFDDDVLKRWMMNAKKQAFTLAKESIKEFKELGVKSVKEGGKKAGEMLIAQVGVAILFSIIFAFSKSCS